jgi:site-specific DNA-methyltransferase (adenine-specific)
MTCFFDNNKKLNINSNNMEIHITEQMSNPILTKLKVKKERKVKAKSKPLLVVEEEDEPTNKIISHTINSFNIIHCEDCIEGMKKMADETVDIVICDPPYNIGKDFGNNSDKQEIETYLLWCDKWITECLRILKPMGTLYIYGFSETLAFIRTRIFCNVRWLVWHYTNKVVPSLNFWQRTHESILCCYKNKPVFNRDDVREPYTDTFLKNAAGKVRKATKGRFSNGETETIYNAHENGALPRDVIKVAALAGGAGKKERVNHPTQKPLTLCDTLIKASKNKEGTTLLVVPFVGSGSECVSAKKNGINFIGFEINSEYIDIANQRLLDIEDDK